MALRARLLSQPVKLTGWLASLDTTKTTIVASSTTERYPPMPCLTYWFWTGGEINDLVDRDRELPANKRDLTHIPDSGELLIHHHHILAKQAQEVHTASRVWQHTRVVSSLAV